MKVRIKDIEERVIALLDENKSIIEDRVEYGDPGMELPSLIRMIIPEAALKVVRETPIGDFRETVTYEFPRPELDGEGRKVVRLPDDFLRLARVRMSDWSRGVRVPLDPEGDAYSLRCGNSLRCRRRQGPAVAITHRTGGLALEIFGTGADSRITCFEYVPLPAVDGAYIEIPAGLAEAVARTTAEMVIDVVGSD